MMSPLTCITATVLIMREI